MSKSNIHFTGIFKDEFENYIDYKHFDDIELELTDDALNAIAAEAIARKTGARGLRSIMEGTLMDTMYTTPSVENVKKIVVYADCVKGTAKPRFYDASGKEITNVPQGI